MATITEIEGAPAAGDPLIYKIDMEGARAFGEGGQIVLNIDCLDANDDSVWSDSLGPTIGQPLDLWDPLKVISAIFEYDAANVPGSYGALSTRAKPPYRFKTVKNTEDEYFIYVYPALAAVKMASAGAPSIALTS